MIDKHFEQIKRITKSFIDSATENFKECAPFSPFIGWATQYIILVRYIQAEDKAEKSMNSIKKEMESKIHKKQQVDSAKESFMKEAFLEYF